MHKHACGDQRETDRGEPAYLAGVSAVGIHNSGVALVEATRERGPRLIYNNEEERFSGEKHTNAYPRQSIAAMLESMADMGVAARDGATLVRTTLEEAPASLSLICNQATPAFSLRDLDRGIRASRPHHRAIATNRAGRAYCHAAS